MAMSDSYHWRMRVSVADAKNKLPKLIKAVESGERVTICRRGVPVADIVRTKVAPVKERVLGQRRGEIRIIDPDWWKPMTDEGVDDFLEGRCIRQPHFNPSVRPSATDTSVDRLSHRDFC
jgi:antitoxin (DNA-binding transcriptional repressor) of toxin-antitoxin stability system